MHGSCRLRLLPPLGLALLAAAPSAAHAQQQTGWRLGGGVGYETYHFADPAAAGFRNLSLLTVPFAARAPLYRGVTFDVSGAWARGDLERPDGTHATLDGATDTQLRLEIPLVRDQATIGAVVVLPSGKATLTQAEAQVAGVVAADLLPFRISSWGTGGGAGMTAALAHSFGPIGLGVAGSYLVGRQFDLVESGSFAYRPGDQLRLRVAADADVGSSGKASLQVTMLRSSDDRLNGANLYRSGDRLEAIGSYAFATGARSSAILYGGALHRSEATFLVQQPTTPALPSQNLFLAGGGLRLPIGRSAILPTADVRLLRSADGLGQGYTAGIGGSAELPLGRAVTLLPTLRGRFGRVLVSQGENSNFTGADIGLSIRFGSTR